MAAVGALAEATTEFQPCADVSYGGVLVAIPALEANGLFRFLHDFKLPQGYYSALHIICTLAYMALLRIRSVEQLQYQSPGELGKLIGLDRIPEVRCVRRKMELLSKNGVPEAWATQLGEHWMELDPAYAGTLYIDGHVRLYHGKMTQLPRRYVSRQRLCLRGTSDYWVSDALGRPFFSIAQASDPGLLKTLEFDVLPRLLKDVPDQPDDDALKANRWLARFHLVFDREGYSPIFIKRMWEAAADRVHHVPQVPRRSVEEGRVLSAGRDARQRQCLLDGARGTGRPDPHPSSTPQPSSTFPTPLYLFTTSPTLFQNSPQIYN